MSCRLKTTSDCKTAHNWPVSWLHYRHTPGPAPSRVTPRARPAHWLAGLVAPAARALMAAGVSIGTGRARPVAASAVPAGLAAVAGAIGGGADVSTLAGAAAGDGDRVRNGPPRCLVASVLALPCRAAAAVCPRLTHLIAEGASVPRVAQAQATGGVAAAVPEVAVTPPVAARAPPARLALTHPGTVVTGRQVAAARGGALHPPVASSALTSAGQLLAADTRGPPAGALAGFGAGGVPPALVAGAVSMVTAAVPRAPAGVLAERTPAVGVAGALAGDGVAPAVRVAPTHLAAVRSPELRRTAWWSPEIRG